MILITVISVVASQFRKIVSFSMMLSDDRFVVNFTTIRVRVGVVKGFEDGMFVEFYRLNIVLVIEAMVKFVVCLMIFMVLDIVVFLFAMMHFRLLMVDFIVSHFMVNRLVVDFFVMDNRLMVYKLSVYSFMMNRLVIDSFMMRPTYIVIEDGQVSTHEFTIFINVVLRNMSHMAVILDYMAAIILMMTVGLHPSVVCLIVRLVFITTILIIMPYRMCIIMRVWMVKRFKNGMFVEVNRLNVMLVIVFMVQLVVSLMIFMVFDVVMCIFVVLYTRLLMLHFVMRGIMVGRFMVSVLMVNNLVVGVLIMRHINLELFMM